MRSMAAILIAAALVSFEAVLPSHGAEPVRRLMFVRKIEVVGNTVLSPADIEAALAPIIARYPDGYIDDDAIEDLRLVLTKAYTNRGYIASGAEVAGPPSADGTLTLSVIEGYLVGIDVSPLKIGSDGSEETASDQSGLQRYLCDRLALPPGGLFGAASGRIVDISLCGRNARLPAAPINMTALRRRIDELLQDPIIDRINVEVQPGEKLGEARIDATVLEKRPWSLYADITNDEPPSVGAIHGTVGGTLHNVLGYGDAVSVAYGRTAGANIANVQFEAPITSYDTRIMFYGSYNGAGVVSSNFSGLDITSIDKVAGIMLTQPLLYLEDDGDSSDQQLRVTQSLRATLSWDYTASTQSLLGQPFSFSPGYANGYAAAAVIHAGVEWMLQRAEHSKQVELVDVRGTLNHGLAMFGATNLPNAPNADFASFLWQAEWARAWDGWKLFVHNTGQLSSQALYAFEQISIGGPATVRGYVQNALVRDSALIGSVELRRMAWRLMIPGLSQTDSDGEIDLGVFVDGGRGWDHSAAGQDPEGILSLGISLEWELRQDVIAEVAYGYGVVRPHGTDILQPVSFNIRMSF